MGIDLFQREFNTKKKGQSQFNAGLAKLDRIDIIKRFLIQAKITEDYKAWFNILMSYKNELIERLSEDDQKKLNEIKKSLIEEQVRYNYFFANNLQYDGNFFSLLDIFEMYLSEMEHEYGLSLPEKEDIGEAADVTG